jgi:MerR family copper efflux transcriptional regulator
MNIGSAAVASGLQVRTIRFYEEIGLVKPERRENGYRDFCDSAVHKLAFLHRARGLGFSIDDCRELLSLYEDSDRASADGKKLAEARVESINKKQRELKALRHMLQNLVDACHGDDRPECPIVDDQTGVGEQ